MRICSAKQFIQGVLALGLLGISLAEAAPRKDPAAAPPCGPRYAALAGEKAKPIKSALAELEKGIEGRFAGADLNWVEGKKRNAKLEKVFQQLKSLNEEEREALLRALKVAYPNLEEAPLLVRIGLNEESGWKKFFQETSTEPTLQPLMIGELRPLVERMPESTRARILAEIGERYPTAGKVPEGSKGDARFWPKRLLDGWLRVLLKGDDTFRAEMARSGKPLVAYQAYLDEVKARVLKKLPAASHYGELSAQDLLGIAKEMQRFLRLPSTKEHLYHNYRGEDGKLVPPLIRLFGSTVKGTSRRGSDLDLGYANINHNFVNGGERLGVHVPGLSQTIAAHLAKHHPQLELNASGKPHFVGTVDDILTALEPFMIEVKPDSIELLVYPREIEAKKLPLRKGPAVYQAPPPVRFPLD
ncbi:MAG: hypothetical protein EOP11_09055 [Proteobacteria bacterium]|nr:MAG: hypothetical protein EOP11_09055 [Pseudomonadota bacterium]